ncbi:translation elongation factor-like protein [Candidatus Woesearchaeota archaeon]|nr:translation elongation factor-like protein [Candidatus Woesearchaeota archaeon]
MPEAESRSEGREIGLVSHFYSHLGVGVIELEDGIQVGDKIRIKGATTDIEQTVESIQLNHEDVKEAAKGESVGIKIAGRVREHDRVYRI